MMVSGILLVTDGASSLDGKAIEFLCAGLLNLAACVAFLVWRHGWALRHFDIAGQQRSVFTDQSGEPALNLDIICLEIAGLIVRVFRLQTNATRLFQQRF